MLSIKTPKRFFEAIKLDIISLPGNFMSKKQNAEYHLKYICPQCSNYRKSFRDPKKQSTCLWQQQWQKRNYQFPRNFGITNYIKYYLGISTKLTKFKNN